MDQQQIEGGNHPMSSVAQKTDPPTTTSAGEAYPVRAGMRDARLYALVYLAAFMSLGHHVDHVIRGNHVGWPLTEHATPFTYSLGVYPLILLGLYLYASGRVGPGYWALLSGSGAVFVAAIHFGPAAVEPPADIINLYERPIVGWLAFGWLVVFIMVLVATCMYEVRSWFRQRKARTTQQKS